VVVKKPRDPCAQFKEKKTPHVFHTLETIYMYIFTQPLCNLDRIVSLTISMPIFEARSARKQKPGQEKY